MVVKGMKWNLLKECFVSKRHKQEPQWKYLKEIYETDKRIEVDEILQKILAMDKLSRNNNIFGN